jgi:hypothetical protein
LRWQSTLTTIGAGGEVSGRSGTTTTRSP